jgi:predicted TIM-barrel fold metal-dependent hydrolase
MRTIIRVCSPTVVILSLATTLEEMDRNHVRQALVSGDPEAVRHWAEMHPDRFLASYDPNLSSPDQPAEVARFEKEAREGRWRAMGELCLAYAGRPLNDPALFPCYEVCPRLGLPVFFHGVPHHRPAPDQGDQTRFVVASSESPQRFVPHSSRSLRCTPSSTTFST